MQTESYTIVTLIIARIKFQEYKEKVKKRRLGRRKRRKRKKKKDQTYLYQLLLFHTDIDRGDIKQLIKDRGDDYIRGSRGPRLNRTSDNKESWVKS